MPADPVIQVENLGKKYTLGIARHDTLRDRLAYALRAPLRRLRGEAETDPAEFWALRGVSFSVKRGEVLGVIGRNGAGKSTLLKILSRITEPTTGRATIRGRVASLLEVGTGFHPELTGRENIFLNGAILGMSRAEIRRKFDEIVAFAEVERFLDTPVKHYSSGMYVRLAFAVAAHLEPEILIVDEVLAVGDLAFQQKCLGKMNAVSRQEGRTVLFVTHNMATVMQLCARTIYFDGGRICGIGRPQDMVKAYVGASTTRERVRQLDDSNRTLSLRGKARLKSVELVAAGASGHWMVGFGEALQLHFSVEVQARLSHFELGLGLFNLQGFELISTLSSWHQPLGPIAAGHYVVTVDWETMDLAPGTYRLGVGIRSEQGLEDYLPSACDFEVVVSAHAARQNFETIQGAFIKPARFGMKPVDGGSVQGSLSP